MNVFIVRVEESLEGIDRSCVGSQLTGCRRISMHYKLSKYLEQTSQWHWSEFARNANINSNLRQIFRWIGVKRVDSVNRISICSIVISRQLWTNYFEIFPQLLTSNKFGKSDSKKYCIKNIIPMKYLLTCTFIIGNKQIFLWQTSQWELKSRIVYCLSISWVVRTHGRLIMD